MPLIGAGPSVTEKRTWMFTAKNPAHQAIALAEDVAAIQLPIIITARHATRLSATMMRAIQSLMSTQHVRAWLTGRWRGERIEP